MAADKIAGVESGGWIGRPLKRREDERLLAGAGMYVADVPVEGALHAAVYRSPHAHARIVRIETAAAAAQPDVVAVWTVADLQGRCKPFGPKLWREPPPNVVERSRPELKHDQQPVLAIDRVRYAGEPVAVVVAGSRYAAEDALELLEVEYELLPVVSTVEQALAPGAPLLNPDWGSNVSVTFTVEKGDIEAAFAAADLVVKERFSSHRYTSVPMETRGVTARPEPDGRLTVWSATQVPHGLRDVLADQFDMAPERIRCVAPDVGGGFGVKGVIHPEEIVVPLLALTLGRPVRWVEDRREHLLASMHAREQVHEVELAVDRDGRIRGLRDNIVVDNGAYNPAGLVGPYNTVAHLFCMYDVPAAHIRARAVTTNKTQHAPYRGAGRAEAIFAMERALDRAAAELGLDPAEVRRRNLVPAAAMPFDTGLLYRDGQPLVLDSGDYPAMLERAMEVVGYDRWRDAQIDGWVDGRYIGIGLASYIEGTAIGPFETASVSVDPAGHVLVASGSASQGQGHETTFAQIAAETLGVPIEHIHFVEGDTAAIAAGFGTIASRSIVVGGTAVLNAAGEVRDKALAEAARRLEAAVEDLELAGAEIRVKGAPAPALSLYELASGGVLTAETMYRPPTVSFSSGVHAAVIEVDEATGGITILRYVVVHDCGRVVNPLIADGQIMGGVAQGVGGALYEELRYDESGQLLTTTFMDYLIPTAVEVPDALLDHQEYPTFRNPLGLKGLGEGGAIPVPALLANALEDALRPFGAVVRETPLTPEYVRRLIAAGRR